MRGVQVLEAAFNEDANLADFGARFKPTFPVGMLSREFIANFSQITPMMRVNVPILFFIDRKGMIQAQYFGNDAFFLPLDDEAALKQHISAEIDKLLKTDAPPAAGRRTGKKK